MKRVVVVGAFDRYNYGDNLMPILFELFLKEFYPGFFSKYQLVFAAITNSDLSRYKVKKSEAMSEILGGRTDDIEAIISIGGEILSASSSTLFLHMNHSRKLNWQINLLKKARLSAIADIFCRRFYNLPWEFPYVPRKEGYSLKVALSTVGGRVSRRNLGVYAPSVKSRLREADYVSVRDSRTENSLLEFCTPAVFPDSAITMAHFASEQFLEQEIGPEVSSLAKRAYICFQAAPKKVGASAQDCVDSLRKAAAGRGLKIKLCPIGYASGHDDIQFLREVQRLSGGEFDLLDELNVWEIMFVIRNAAVFVGTSLHGVITALAFSVPYIGLNRKIRKLDCFVADWGVETSNRCYSVTELPGIFETVINTDQVEFQEHSTRLLDLGLANNHRLIQALELEK